VARREVPHERNGAPIEQSATRYGGSDRHAGQQQEPGGAGKTGSGHLCRGNARDDPDGNQQQCEKVIGEDVEKAEDDENANSHEDVHRGR
jgi:hypothetical protein